MAALIPSFPHALSKPHHLHHAHNVAAATTRPEAPSLSAAPNPANSCLRRLIARDDLAEAARLIERSTSRGEAPDVYLCTKLIRNLCRRGRTSDAAHVLRSAEGSSAPVDVFTYNTLVAGYCRYGRLDAARCLIASMLVASSRD